MAEVELPPSVSHSEADDDLQADAVGVDLPSDVGSDAAEGLPRIHRGTQADHFRRLSSQDRRLECKGNSE